jgi:uncharacterized membrane protein YbaN (DUF454 family)
MRRPDAIVLKLVRMTLGTTLVAVGLAGLFIPVMPGWLLIIPGLAVLARDFAWAERLHLSIKRRFEQARASMAHRNPEDAADRDAA